MRYPFLVVTMLCAAPALADDPSSAVAVRYGTWQRCLKASLQGQPSGLAHAAAVDRALAACGRSETAYLDTLAASPLFDAGEIDATRATIRARATGTLMIAARDRMDPVTTGSIGARQTQRRP